MGNGFFRCLTVEDIIYYALVNPQTIQRVGSTDALQQEFLLFLNEIALLERIGYLWKE